MRDFCRLLNKVSNLAITASVSNFIFAALISPRQRKIRQFCYMSEDLFGVQLAKLQFLTQLKSPLSYIIVKLRYLLLG